MRISDVIRAKGNAVVTVEPQMDVRTLLGVLAEHGIGAVVVSSDGTTVEGIVSERDIVRALADRGATVISEPVSAIMTADVKTCPPDAPVVDLMLTMTEGRFRHVPVVSGGKLAGIVSIGDIVKNRVGELEIERDSLSRYITTGTS
ncbi:MAG: CBS domain-containing protein [Jiangellaceae bacterium]|jgi:CBS domain-containing protein|nr:CBS domain-containing protein [Jiangellaceae bacterium]